VAEASSTHPYVYGMAAVHKIYRSSFASAPAFIESAVEDEHRRALVANYYTNILASVGSHHDGEEECLFPLLIERAPKQRDVVELGIEEHQQVLALLAAATTANASWESKGDAETQELVSALGSLDRALSAHLDHEEGMIVPLAIEHVTVEEWAMIPAHGVAHFKGDKLWLIVGLDLENRTPEQRAAMLDNMTPEWREWWDTVGEPSFNDLIAEVRQTH
jgi:iron-sulfur cluster repair protein YtfE (RIC family)